MHIVTDTVKTAGEAEPLVDQERSSALLTIIVLCFGGMSVALTQTLVIPIQIELPRLLSANAADAAWVVTSTLLAAAVTMPIAGRLGDMFGKQRVLAGRTLQGLAMGFIPVGISLMREVVPPAMATTAVAAMSATLGVGGAIGLPLSAWIAETGDCPPSFGSPPGLPSFSGSAAGFPGPTSTTPTTAPSTSAAPSASRS